MAREPLVLVGTEDLARETLLGLGLPSCLSISRVRQPSRKPTSDFCIFCQACVASKGAYPDIETDGVLAVGPLTSEVPSVTANLGQYCSEYDPTTIVNIWGEKPVSDVISGALEGESAEDTIARLFDLSKVAITPGSIPKGNLVDITSFSVNATLGTDWATLSCPRLGGPTCPDGLTCPGGFEARGGTEEGNAFYIESDADTEEESVAKEEDHDHEEHDHDKEEHAGDHDKEEHEGEVVSAPVETAEEDSGAAMFSEILFAAAFSVMALV